MLPMLHGMTEPRALLSHDAIDAAIDFGALALRAVAYAVLWAAASPFDCGRALLTGAVAGDLAATAVGLLLRRHHGIAPALAEGALLLLVMLWCRHQLAWPDEPALRALVGLAAFGVFAPRVGGSVWTRLGPSENRLL
jgi:hypothetical protein